MSTTLATLRDISKKYSLYETPSNRLKQMLLGRFGKNFSSDFWALKNINLDLDRGQALGIIGRNGSGKSTLLQIIAGTLSPTTGTVNLNGKIGALLELGSGFNPEFSGNENIYSGAIALGYSHEWLGNNIGAIRDFAELPHQFLDQPVKTYSTGMLMRLAIALHAVTEPEILIIDEAFAVGDIFFKQKCYNLLDRRLVNGTSLILVSHSTSDIERICKSAILLNKGEIEFSGDSVEAIRKYYLIEQQNKKVFQATSALKKKDYELHSSSQIAQDFPVNSLLKNPINSDQQISNGAAKCIGVILLNDDGDISSIFAQGDWAHLYHLYYLNIGSEVPVGGFTMRDDHNVIVHGKNSFQFNELDENLRLSDNSYIGFRHSIKLDIASGEYTLEVALASCAPFTYRLRAIRTVRETYSEITRICSVPRAKTLQIKPKQNSTFPKMFSGVADLEGSHAIFSIKDIHSANEQQIN